MAYRYLSPAWAPGTVPAQVVSAGSVWPASLASGTGVPPLILTATASTNGAQTRNVVVPSLCGDAPSGAAEVQGVAAPGIATGTALHRMEELANQVLPPGIGFEWTEIAYQQQ